jgi:hypothetical protein
MAGPLGEMFDHGCGKCFGDSVLRPSWLGGPGGSLDFAASDETLGEIKRRLKVSRAAFIGQRADCRSRPTMKVQRADCRSRPTMKVQRADCRSRPTMKVLDGDILIPVQRSNRQLRKWPVDCERRA